jgi:hypothetical protein
MTARQLASFALGWAIGMTFWVVFILPWLAR